MPLRIAAVLFAAGVLAASAAHARGIRPLFEPTDLELENPGVAEIDLQIGGIRSQGPWRAVLPDFELDLGVLPNLELDLDGAYAVEGPDNGPFSFDHSAPDSLWPSLKLGIFDWHDDDSRRGWAIGVQVGPKLPVAAGAHGLGVESLLLVGGTTPIFRTVLNFGGFVDPAPDPTSGRPIGVEAGIDLEVHIDGARDRFFLTGELSSVYFLSSDPHQLLATAGFTWSVTPAIDLSLVGLWGLLVGSDRYGVLFGFSPKLRLFGVGSAA